ncbi:MAG: HEPN domain-containing protein [Candidatus Binataceae bacterium]
MPHDSALVAETRDWLAKANEDLEVAQRLLTGRTAWPSSAAFHAQQAAEKAEKAFLTWHRKRFSKTHDLDVLGGKCAAIDPALEAVCKAVNPISVFAVGLRYPNLLPRLTTAKAREALELARAMYDAVLERLPKAVKP